jgi:DNA-binding CsgD family transcriptional regulator
LGKPTTGTALRKEILFLIVSVISGLKRGLCPLHCWLKNSIAASERTLNHSEANYLASIDLIQEAALEPIAWIKVLRQLARLTECVAGSLSLRNLDTGESAPIAHFGFDGTRREEPFIYYPPTNPHRQIDPAMKHSFVVATGKAAATDELRTTGSHIGLAPSANRRGSLALVLHRKDSLYCQLTLVRPEGTGDPSAQHSLLLNRLTPHLTRAIRVSLQLEAMRHRHLVMETTLTQIAVAVLLLDRRMHVVFANPDGEKLLASGSALTTVRNVLTARTLRSNQQLQKAILEVVLQKCAGRTQVSIEREKQRPLLATVLPVATESPIAPVLESTACCAVFVTDPNSVQASRSSAFARIYGLTPAETRLLDWILTGAGPAQAAQEMGIRPATARTHLMHIFSKTRTCRQAELINLVMASTPPLSGRA